MFEVPVAEGYEWPERTAPYWWKMLRKIFHWIPCDDCVAMLDKQFEPAKQKRRTASAKAQSLQSEWILPDVIAHRFDKSDRKHEEATNQICTAFEWGRDWMPKQPKNSAFIEGTKGAGKSYFAHCILNAAMDQGMAVREIQALHIQELATDWDNKRAARKTMTELKHIGCLLIEELGLVSWNDYGAIALREIIDYRTRMHMPILITSNLSIRELRYVWDGNEITKGCLKNGSIAGPMLDRMQNFVGFQFKRDSSLRTTPTVIDQEDLF